MNKLENIKDVLDKYSFILTPNQKRWGVVVVILTFLGAICEMLGVSIILPLVQVMIAPQQLWDNIWVAKICEILGVSSDASLVWLVGGTVIFIYLLKNLFLLFLSYVRVKYACKVQRELSIETLQAYMKRGYVFFLNAGTGELLRGILKSIIDTYTGLYQIFRLLAEALTIFLICIYIMLSDFTMALCVVVLAILCLMAVVFGSHKWVKKCGEIYHKYTGLVNKTLIQTFQGIKEILVMEKEDYFLDTFREHYEKQQKGEIGKTIGYESPTYIIEAICVGGLIVAVCFKAISADETSTLVPQLAAFAVAAFRILPSLGRISSYFNQFTFCITGINDTYCNIKEVRNQKEKKNIYNQKKTILEDKSVFNGKMSVEKVSWRYPDADLNVLEDVSIDIKKGESIAFVGKSGAGKTTLADIILGLLTPQKGCVKIDGVAIQELENKNRMVGYVPQMVNLLDDTIRRNVAFGVKDNEIDDKLVWKALEQAQMKESVENYSEGLDTEIGERGIHFSGGQRQRLAIARALYNNPDILVFDEATSALDTETETAVMDAINSLKGEKTLIIIAHRLTTIRNCDKIYEIVNGKSILKKFEDFI